jgi:thiol:disulfide interchange protein DsbC
MRSTASLVLLPLMLMMAAPASAQQATDEREPSTLVKASAEAQKQLRQTFTNLQFEDFGPAPVKGPVYQAIAGGRIIYFAPESEHLLFAAIYDKNGTNLTALAQDANARRQISTVDPANALAIGPAGAPQVVEFTDPDCPYCQALDRFWSAKAAEGRPVRRLVYFVSGMHAQAAALAQHIMCSSDPQAAFAEVYAGSRPEHLLTCKGGADKVAQDMEAVRKMGISGTPSLFVDGKSISGFQQGELEAFLEAKYADREQSR